MKAIHNATLGYRWDYEVGNYKLKYNFESNSQQIQNLLQKNFVGNYKLKYNFESNSQRTIRVNNNIKVGNYKLKYNFESNSQHTNFLIELFISWEL